MSTIKPIFLLADSQLLFWRDEGGLFLDRARALLAADDEVAERNGRPPRAAYLGASNGDAPEFYDLFVAAMEQIAITDCRQIPSLPAPEDLEFLATADLILLAGGSVEKGWRAFKEASLDQKLVERYYGGTLLIGISAGAVQLGLKGWDDACTKTRDMLRIVPFVVDAHDEPSWARLHQAVQKAGEHGRGLGIPSGGGAIYHPDYSVEPVRQAIVEVDLTEEGPRQALLLPGQHSEPQPPSVSAASPDAASSDAARPGDASPDDASLGDASPDSARPDAASSAAGPSAAEPAASGAATAGAPAGAPSAHANAAVDAADPGDSATAAGRARTADPSAAAGAAGPEGATASDRAAKTGRPADPAAGSADAAGSPRAPAPTRAEPDRAALGYSIRPDGIIEIHRPDDGNEPVN